MLKLIEITGRTKEVYDVFWKEAMELGKNGWQVNYAGAAETVVYFVFHKKDA